MKRIDQIRKTFWKNISPEPNSGCWLWTGKIDRHGYGYFKSRTLKTWLAHRASYILLRGEIPAELTLDHLCRVHSCVNPDHLEPCTVFENIRRSPSYKGEITICLRGHTFTPENTEIYKGRRRCIECRRMRGAKYDRAKREAGFVKQNNKWVKP